MKFLLTTVANIMQVAAIWMLISGALVASQKEHLGSAEVLLLCVGLVVLADLLRKLGVWFGNDSRKEPTLPK
jgi:hypothetical protein